MEEQQAVVTLEVEERVVEVLPLDLRVWIQGPELLKEAPRVEAIEKRAVVIEERAAVIEGVVQL